MGYNGGGMGIDDRDHKQYPQRKMLISEFSSGRGTRGVYEDKVLGTLSTETLGDGRQVEGGKYCNIYGLCRAHEAEWSHIVQRPGWPAERCGPDSTMAERPPGRAAGRWSRASSASAIGAVSRTMPITTISKSGPPCRWSTSFPTGRGQARKDNRSGCGPTATATRWNFCSTASRWA